MHIGKNKSFFMIIVLKLCELEAEVLHSDGTVFCSGMTTASGCQHNS